MMMQAYLEKNETRNKKKREGGKKARNTSLGGLMGIISGYYYSDHDGISSTYLIAMRV